MESFDAFIPTGQRYCTESESTISTRARVDDTPDHRSPVQLQRGVSGTRGRRIAQKKKKKRQEQATDREFLRREGNSIQLPTRRGIAPSHDSRPVPCRLNLAKCCKCCVNQLLHHRGEMTWSAQGFIAEPGDIDRSERYSTVI
jgi:hypothetical protein